jgi:hypothetical protein
MKFIKNYGEYGIEFGKKHHCFSIWFKNYWTNIRDDFENFHFGIEIGTFDCFFISLWLFCFAIEFDF